MFFFCSIIQSWGEDSDACRKQTSQEIVNTGKQRQRQQQADGRKYRNASRNKTDFPQGSFPLHLKEVVLK